MKGSLAVGGMKSNLVKRKVFLQSDVEAVALRMKQLFLKHGEGKLELVLCEHANNSRGGVDENPFGIRSDWDRHVLNREAPMYRLMLRKIWAPPKIMKHFSSFCSWKNPRKGEET